MNVADLFGAKWKIGTVAFGIATIALGATCFIYRAENASLRAEITTIRIDLATAKNNEAVLGAAIEDQNRELELFSAESKRKLALANAKLADAQKARRTAEGRVMILLGKPIPGSTLEERVRAVDAQVLETLR